MNKIMKENLEVLAYWGTPIEEKSGKEYVVGVPEISDKELEKYMKKIKPVGWKIDNDKWYLYWIDTKNVDPRKTPFMISYKFLEKATGLKKIDTIVTKHPYEGGYPGAVHASIAEVIAQIPKEYIDKIVAFELPSGLNESDSRDAVEFGYQEIETILYTKDNK